MVISSLQVKHAVVRKGYIWHPVVNIVGIRNLDSGSTVTNIFDDAITLSYYINNELQFEVWPATTDPGKKGVQEYGNPKGVARLVEGQYINSHALGLHKGKYEALVQVAPVKVWRDSNKDLIYDEKIIDQGLFGINIHRAGIDSTYVENWSEGCQVFKRQEDFNQFLTIVKSLNIPKFTYTLINNKDLI
jgi:hypothetical protein